MEGKRKKVLWIGDFATTGFGEVTTHICDYLYSLDKYNLVVLGTNYYGWKHDKPYWVYSIYPGDYYGEKRLREILFQEAPDIIIQLNDAFCVNFMKNVIIDYKAEIKKRNAKNPIPTYILYFPVDSETVLPEMIDAVNTSDIAVTYLEWGKRILKDKVNKEVKVIPHGVEEKEYFDIGEEKRNAMKKEWHFDDYFMIGQANRNQPRKMLWRSMQIFKLFNEGYNACSCGRYYSINLKQCPFCHSSEIKYTKTGVANSRLYLHCKNQDVDGILARKAIHLGLYENKVIIPQDYDIARGFPIPILNTIFNCFDIGMTTTVGEGWGLGMSNISTIGRIPLVLPEIQAFKEIYPEDLVYWMKVTDFVMLRDDNDVIRNLCDIDTGVDALFKIYNNMNEAKEKAKALREHIIKTYNWNIVNKKWEDLIDGINEVKPIFDLQPV